MKVYLKPPKVASPSLVRVTNALTRFKPDNVEITDNKKEADLTIIHVIGRQDQVSEQAVGKYAVIQYALRSTLRPKVHGWLNLWGNAQLVWSYYDLPELCREDKVIADFDFYHSPLGVDESFERLNVSKRYIVATTGQSYLTESVRECIFAARELGLSVFHLGEDVKRENVVCKTGITDYELASVYSQCEFVSGLRRVEGFELPAAEGLVCGARPILFDQPHYRQWYEGLGVFIPEAPRDEVIKSLTDLFKVGPVPISNAEIQEAKRRFNWQSIIKGFWERLL